LNTRKRGKNQPKDKEKEKDAENSKSPNPPKRTQTGTISTSEGRENPTTLRESSDDDSDTTTKSTLAPGERPQRTPTVLPKNLKRDHPGASVAAEAPKEQVKNKEDYRPASCYEHLTEGQFRILKLAPGPPQDDADDIISCSFAIATMDPNQSMKYEAISYLWGVPNQKSEKIHLVDAQGKEHPIYIRSNLYQALKNLRHPKKERLFWVDALCVNHSSGNLPEKKMQAAMKRYVFRNATNLCFWLGEDESAKKALKFIPKIMDLTAIERLVSDKNSYDDWAAFVALLRNPVFSRLMIVQEVAVAQNITLHCGQPAIYYGDLVDAVAMFKCYRNKIAVLFRKNGRNPKELSDRQVTMAERFIEVSVNALRVITTSNGEQKTIRLLSLEALVSYLHELNATDGLDRIYSVLAIANDGPKLHDTTQIPVAGQEAGLIPLFDYDAEVAAVYRAFVIQSIQKSRSLDIICRYWARPVKNETLPTWVRPTQLHQKAIETAVSERTEADSLVGLPDHNNYHASRGTLAQIDAPISASTLTLTVTGFRLDIIATLAPRASEGIILYEWLSLGGCKKNSRHQITVPDAFWRTLVADRGPMGTMPPSWYSRAFDYCLLHSNMGDINTNRLLQDCEADSSLVVGFLQRVQSIIWNRKFLVSETYKWIGLAPTAAEEKDVLVILHGCSVPVVLRPVKEEGQVVGWLLVGECYVHGMMDGEAMGFREVHKIVEEQFEIR
jgi:hypothetical protein